MPLDVPQKWEKLWADLMPSLGDSSSQLVATGLQVPEVWNRGRAHRWNGLGAEHCQGRTWH